MAQSSTRLSSIYTSGQCLLSVLGSIGVILLFAGIPQLIYASHVSAGSLLTFLLGALLITLMVTGNAFIGYKYRQLIRDRRERDSRSNSFSRVEDKPPSYDDLIKQEELPPTYAAVTQKPPRYEDYINEVFNWEAAARVSCATDLPCQSSSQPPPTCSQRELCSETPIIVPLHKHLRGQRVHRQNAFDSIHEEEESSAGHQREFKIQVENYSYANPGFEGARETSQPNSSKNGSLTQADRQKLFFNPSFENETIEEACPENSPTNCPTERQPQSASSSETFKEETEPDTNPSNPPDYCEDQLPVTDSSISSSL